MLMMSLSDSSMVSLVSIDGTGLTGLWLSGEVSSNIIRFDKARCAQFGGNVKESDGFFLLQYFP